MRLFLLAILMMSVAQAKSLHDYKIKSAKGKEINFKDYQGKPTLVVNIATKCGYTPQLDGLEALAKKYKDKLNVVGVPSNDFGGQTPEEDAKVAEFCRLNYGVTFPLTTKVPVKGSKKHPLYSFLVGEGDEVSWNFEKFLISKDGKVVKRFKSGVKPLDKELTSQVEELLN